MAHTKIALLLALGVSCAAPSPEALQSPLSNQTLLYRAGDTALLGAPRAYLPESDAPVVYDLWLEQQEKKTPLHIAALDATVDASTQTISWVSPQNELLSSSLKTPLQPVLLAQNVIPGLVARQGKIAYSVRVDGPESAAFWYDTQTQKTQLLEDGVGADEVLALSPDGTKALLLCSRTGLSSLYQKNIGTRELVQLTNVGIKAGPSLDPSLVAPNPTRASEVVWGAKGIAYRSQEGAFLLTLDGKLSALPAGALLEEAAQ